MHLHVPGVMGSMRWSEWVGLCNCGTCTPGRVNGCPMSLLLEGCPQALVKCGTPAWGVRQS
eukprot:347157-Chlamydomonas_euryale.AAC.2